MDGEAINWPLPYSIEKIEFVIMRAMLDAEFELKNLGN